MYHFTPTSIICPNCKREKKKPKWHNGAYWYCSKGCLNDHLRTISNKGNTIKTGGE